MTMKSKFIWTVALLSILGTGAGSYFPFKGLVIRAQTPQFNITQYRAAFDFEQLTVSNSEKKFTSSKYLPSGSSGVNANPALRADFAVLNCDDNGQTGTSQRIRYRYDGTASSATVGVEFRPATDLPIPGLKNITNFSMFREGSNDVVCEVHYLRFTSNTP